MSSEPENVLKALSSPTRRTIMRQISEKGSATYTEIMQVLGLDPSLMSGTFNYHLKELAEAGLIERINGEYRISDLGKRALVLVDQVAKDTKVDQYGVLSAVMSMSPTQEFDLFANQMGLWLGFILTILSVIPVALTRGSGTFLEMLAFLGFVGCLAITLVSAARLVDIIKRFKVGFSVILFLSTDWFFIRSPNRNRFFILSITAFVAVFSIILAMILPAAGEMGLFSTGWLILLLLGLSLGLFSVWLFVTTKRHARALEELQDA